MALTRQKNSTFLAVDQTLLTSLDNLESSTLSHVVPTPRYPGPQIETIPIFLIGASGTFKAVPIVGLGPSHALWREHILTDPFRALDGSLCSGRHHHRRDSPFAVGRPIEHNSRKRNFLPVGNLTELEEFPHVGVMLHIFALTNIILVKQSESRYKRSDKSP